MNIEEMLSYEWGTDCEIGSEEWALDFIFLINTLEELEADGSVSDMEQFLTSIKIVGGEVNPNWILNDSPYGVGGNKFPNINWGSVYEWAGDVWFGKNYDWEAICHMGRHCFDLNNVMNPNYPN